MSMTGWYGNVNVQIRKAIGGRSAQQDHHFVTPTEINSAAKAKKRLESAFTYAKEKTAQIKSGTCATVALMTSDHYLTVTSVGDSPAILYVVNADKKVIAYRLNKPHKPNDPEEKEWIESHGGTVTQHDKSDGTIIARIDSDLAISRALGDCHHGDKIRKIPDITQVNLDDYIRPGDTAFLCVSCDGLFEKNIMESDYAEIISQAVRDNRVGDITELMKDYAIHRGSSDNITILLAQIPASLNQNMALCVCDGHCGDKAATQACTTLRKEIGTGSGLHPNAPNITITPPVSLPPPQEATGKWRSRHEENKLDTGLQGSRGA